MIQQSVYIQKTKRVVMSVTVLFAIATVVGLCLWNTDFRSDTERNVAHYVTVVFALSVVLHGGILMKLNEIGESR